MIQTTALFQVSGYMLEKYWVICSFPSNILSPEGGEAMILEEEDIRLQKEGNKGEEYDRNVVKKYRQVQGIRDRQQEMGH